MYRNLTNDECGHIVYLSLQALDGYIPNNATHLDEAVIYSEIIRQLQHDVNITIKNIK